MDASLVSKTRIFRRNNKCIPRIRRGNTLFNGAKRRGGRIDSLSTWQGRRNFDEPAELWRARVYIYIYIIQEEILDFRGSGFRGKSTSRKGIVFLCPPRVIDGYLSAGETLFFAPKKFPPGGENFAKTENSLHTFFFNLPLLKGMIERLFNFAQINLKANNIIS